ncbi:MAG: serine protease, partial [bacterium]|nr:serine protease [bacterium]
MKIKNGTFKYFILAGLIALTSISESFGQVITRVLSPEDKIENYIPWYNPDEEIPIVNAPFVDVEAVLEEDEQTGREMPRIGIKQEVNYTTENGLLKEKGNYSLWNMTLRSANAKSMSIRFDNSNLPENAVMFLFNKASRFIVGPIKNSNFRDGTFISDYLNGDHINMIIFLPNGGFSTDLSLDITSFDYGILEFDLFDESFETSEECNVNVACEEGNGWECQSGSVCKIIDSSIGACTGTLMNNECCDLSPFILTAAHCVFNFSTDEFHPVGGFRFRFNYQSPQCTPNGETTPWQWVAYFGSEVRAMWDGTDFGLLELVDDIGEGVSLSGWDRRNNVPADVTMIHHPSGDVKKISFDANPVIDPDPVDYGDYVLLGGNSFRVTMNEFGQGDFGVLEGGSSGCGYFNENGRLVSQHSGGFLEDCENEFDKWSGRISESWEGNGTPDSRLRDWLGASTNPNTMDCMQHPIVEGPEVLCTDPKTFTLMNNMPCVKTVTWRVEPANFFASPSSGNGVTASLWGNNTSSGPATLIYTLSAEGCNDAEVGYDLFVG